MHAAAPTAVAPPLVRRLLSADAYPHAVEAIRLVETHISWVFLTGRHAYKVKKPVDLGFLDFTSLERRRHFCDEEVRLNGRFAPDLYRGSVPIVGPPERALVGGAGEPIEWAVHLVQFDERDRLDHVLERGALTVADCQALAADIAAVQRGLAVAPVGSPWGTAETFRRVVHLNLDQLGAHRPDLAARAAALGAWVDTRIDTHAGLLAARREAGMIRECHGDLHLANLVRHGGRIVAFDGIEFNEALRWIDVANDVAFLAMDLRARGRGDLAATVSSGWVEASGDHGCLPLLPVYLVYRAIVRAAVAAIRAAQAGDAADGPVAAADACLLYLDLAERLARPRRPTLVATCGISGSGKSTVAGAVAAAIDGIRVRSDVERKRLAGLAPLERPADPDAVYGEAMTRRTYARLAEIAADVLRAGYSAVVDAACLRRWQRDCLARAAADVDADLVWLELDVAPETAAARVRARADGGLDPSDAGTAVVAAQRASRDPITAEETASQRVALVRVAADQGFDRAAIDALVRRLRPD